MAVETGRRQPAAPRFQQRPLLGRTHQHQRSLAVPDAYQHFVLVRACTDIPLPDVRNMAVRTTCPVRQRKEERRVGIRIRDIHVLPRMCGRLLPGLPLHVPISDRVSVEPAYHEPDLADFLHG